MTPRRPARDGQGRADPARQRSGRTCTFYEKALNAQNAGAAAVVLYNNVAGALSPTVAGSPPITIPVVAITAADGVSLDGRIAAGPTDADVDATRRGRSRTRRAG